MAQKHLVKTAGIVFFATTIIFSAMAENGYNLWLRYVPVADTVLRALYRSSASQIVIQGSAPALAAASAELKRGLDGLLSQNTPASASVTANGAIVAGTPSSSSIVNGLGLVLDADPEAYRIVTMTASGRSATVIASRGETGVLYGVFHLLRLVQTNRPAGGLDISEKPKIRRRLLNHWDNASGTIERGYAGNSLWQWSQLPNTLSPRYQDYARACASIGINGAVLNNVNADASFLTAAYIAKIKALADVFRPYGIRVYLSANFAAPSLIGGLSTADPLNAQVIAWWAAKADELYASITDFGGFLVKANSESQPGPKTYGRTHAQGANCLADALAPHGGVVIWRAFVYDDVIDPDRMKRAYKEFKPLDGQFRNNVIIQAKNGPFDFQPREPVHPLFGGLVYTHIGMEFQITLEYLGQGIHLVYMGPYWKEVLDFDTYARGAGSTVGRVIDGTVYGDTVTCISGVANTGLDSNWCGHHFHQANWYAYGRLAWDCDLSSDTISGEWAKMTWGNSAGMVGTVKAMMAGSREACVNYMDPLGLGGIFNHTSTNNHYGPDPGWNGDLTHADWNSVYWHRADAAGVGYDRTTAGSDFVSQYFPAVRDRYNGISTTPDEYLCWFHHVSWGYLMRSGRTFWNELCYRYCIGCQYVTNLRAQWGSLNGQVDAARYSQVSAKLLTHETDANTWRTTCLNYFRGFSGMAIPVCNPVSAAPPRPRLADNPGGCSLKMYDLLGKLVYAFPEKKAGCAVDMGNTSGSNLRPGIYILRQGGSVPSRVILSIVKKENNSGARNAISRF